MEDHRIAADHTSAPISRTRNVPLPLHLSERREGRGKRCGGIGLDGLGGEGGVSCLSPRATIKVECVEVGAIGAIVAAEDEERVLVDHRTTGKEG